MERADEIMRIENAILQGLNLERLSKVCQQILMERIDKLNFNDMFVSNVVKNLATSSFSGVMTFETEEKEISTTNHGLSESIVPSSIALLGFFFLFVSSTPLRILGWFSAIYSGAKLGPTIISNYKKGKMKQEQVKKMALSLHNRIDNIYNEVLKLERYSQLESRYKSILRWLQAIYNNGKTDEVIPKDSILHTLQHLGYEFIEYSVEFKDFFETSEADVNEPKTSLFAIRNRSSKEIVVLGHVLIPFTCGK